MYIVCRCPCKTIFFVVLQSYPTVNGDIAWQCLSVLPRPNPLLIFKTPDGFPPELKGDYQEAFSCLRNGEFKASACMSRRVLGIACELLGATVGIRLVDQIKELADAKKVQEPFDRMAHQIRILGNWGAHKQADDLKDITQAEAQQVYDFAYEFINIHFIVPHDTAKLEKRINPPKAEPYWLKAIRGLLKVI